MLRREAAIRGTTDGQAPRLPSSRQPGAVRPVPVRSGPALRWRRVFPGQEAELRQVRYWLAELLPDCPARGDVVTVTFELAANAVRHSASGLGGFFAVELSWLANPATVRVAVADAGGLRWPAGLPPVAGWPPCWAPARCPPSRLPRPRRRPERHGRRCPRQRRGAAEPGGAAGAGRPRSGGAAGADVVGAGFVSAGYLANGPLGAGPPEPDLAVPDLAHPALPEDGRGLRLVAALAARAGVVGDHRGRLVWADVRWVDDTPISPGPGRLHRSAAGHPDRARGPLPRGEHLVRPGHHAVVGDGPRARGRAGCSPPSRRSIWPSCWTCTG